MTNSLSDLTERLLSAARKAGADNADAIAVNGTSMEISVRTGKLEGADRSEGTEVGLRVIVGQKQACVSSSDVSQAALEQMAERAMAMASVAPDDPDIVQARPDQFAQSWDTDALDMVDRSVDPTAEALKDAALAVEDATLAVKGVSQAQTAAAGYGSSEIYLATSQGFQGGYARTDHSVYSVAISGEGAGMQRDSDGDSRCHHADLRSVADIGTRAGERSLAMQGAKKPPTGAYPVVYDERIAASLIGHILGACNGASVHRGGSWLRDKLGQQIIPAHLNVIENPLRAKSGRSRPFDAEGLPVAERNIIENGVLTGWTLDLSTAQKMGMASTASAMRGTSAPPSPGTTNIELTQGTQTQAELLRDMGTGLLITSMIGSTINATTGDYSRGASGFWIEDGEIAFPVNEFTMAGNLLDMLQTIVPANDAIQHKASIVPSLLVEGMTIAGA